MSWKSLELHFVYFEPGFDPDLVAYVCESFPDADFMYGDDYARFHGPGESFEGFKRALSHFGLKIKHSR